MNNTQPYDVRDEHDDAFFSKPSFWLGVLVALVLWLLWVVLMSGTTTLFVHNTPTAQQTASALSAIETARETFEETYDETVVIDTIAQVEAIIETPVPREVYTAPILYTPPVQPASAPIETTPVVPVPTPAPVGAGQAPVPTPTPVVNPTPGVQETYAIPFIGMGGGGGPAPSGLPAQAGAGQEEEPEPEPDPVPDAPVIVTPADLEQTFSTTKITFEGTATSNATIEVVYGALESSAETTADAEGDWTIAITFAEGESNMSVTATTDAGTSDPLTATITINVPPSVPVVDAVDTPSVVEDITFTGTGTAGNTISCACGNPEPDTTTVLEDGTWSMGPLFFANGSTTAVSFTHIEPGEGGLVSDAVSFDVVVELAEDPGPGDGPGGGPEM